MIDFRNRKVIDAAAYALWAAVWAYCVFGFFGQTYDDVYLAYVYAKNILAGHGFVFNPGEKVLGTPAPLFVLLLIVFKSFFSFWTIPQIGSLISGTGLALAGLAVYMLGRRYSQRLLGLLGGLLAVFNPFSVLTLGGETPLYLCFVLWAFYLYITERENRASFLLGLALMNRTEAVVPICLLLLAALFQKRGVFWKMTFIIVLTMLPWLVFAFAYFGTPVTGSFTAKLSQIPAGLPRYPIGLWRWSRDVVFGNNYYLAAVLPLSLLGMVSLFWTKTGWRLIVSWCVLQTLFYASLPIPFYHWYAAQIGVLCAVLSALGAVEMPELFGGTARSLRLIAEKINTQKTATFYIARRWTGAFIATSVVCGILMAFAFFAGVRSAVRYQKFIPHHPSNLIYQKTGRWFAENSPPRSRIAYLEIGQIAFYADRYIIDTLGLVTPGVAKQVAKLNWPWAVEKYRADYVIYNAGFRDWILPVVNRPWFKEGFEEVARITEPGYPSDLVIYRNNGSAKFSQPSEPDTAQLRHEGTVGEIYGEKIIRQVFPVSSDNLCGIELLPGTFARQNTGMLRVAVLNEAKQLLYETKTSISKLADNAWWRFDFPPVADSAGKRFIIEVSSAESQTGDAVTLWKTSRRDAVKDGGLYYSGKRQDGALAFKSFVTALQDG